MSNKERFDLYKHFECMKSILMRYSSGCKYEKDSLEYMYAKKINEDINDFVYVLDKSVMDMTFNHLIVTLKNRFTSYMCEIFRKENIENTCSLNFECSFDELVKQVNDVVLGKEKKCNVLKNIDDRINDVIKDIEICTWIETYIDKIRLQAINFNSLSEYYENEKCIDEMITTLKEMVAKYSIYLNKAKIIEELLGDYAPEVLKEHLRVFKKAIWEGRFISADSTLWSMNSSLTRFKAIKYEANCTLDIVNQNYNNRLNRVRTKENVDIANKIYSIVIDIIQNVLKGIEDRNMLNTLKQITFKDINEIYELVSYKTKGIYVGIYENETIDKERLLVKIDSDDKHFYCFSYPEQKVVKFTKRILNKKYVSLYNLYGKRNKVSEDLDEILDSMNIPVAKESGLSVINTINRVVEFIDEQRMNTDRNNDMVLKREK